MVYVTQNQLADALRLKMFWFAQTLSDCQRGFDAIAEEQGENNQWIVDLIQDCENIHREAALREQQALDAYEMWGNDEEEDQFPDDEELQERWNEEEYRQQLAKEAAILAEEAAEEAAQKFFRSQWKRIDDEAKAKAEAKQA